MADHRLLAIIGIAQFQALTAFALEARRTLTNRIRIIRIANTAIETDTRFICRVTLFASCRRRFRIANTFPINTFCIDGTFTRTTRCGLTIRSRCARWARNTVRSFNLNFTIGPAKRRWTSANIAAIRIKANAAIQTRISQRTFVDIILAQRSRISRSRAVALKAGHLVDAIAIVQARHRLTIVPIDLAIRTGETFRAFTFEFVGVRCHLTRSIVQAWLAGTQRMYAYLRFAMCSDETGRTCTMIVAAIVLTAGAAILARFQLARWPRIYFAIFAIVPCGTVTFVAIGSRYAKTVLHARLVQAIVDRRSNEHILIGTLAGCQRTWTELHDLGMHCTRIE